MSNDTGKTSKTLAALALAGAAAASGAAEGGGAGGGYRDFADFAARHGLAADGRDSSFLNQTEKLSATIRVVPDPKDPMAGRLETTIIHRGYGQAYDLQENIRVNQDGTIASSMTGTGQYISNHMRRAYDSLAGEFQPAASGGQYGYDSPVGKVLRDRGYGIGGASGPAGDYHKIVDPASRTYGIGSCMMISDVAALCTTGFFLDQSSQYKFKMEMFRANAGQVTVSSFDYARPYETNRERGVVESRMGDRSGVYRFDPP